MIDILLFGFFIVITLSAVGLGMAALAVIMTLVERLLE